MAAERPRPAGPVARLFGSLATALIDLGLPTIRAWLRDRLGPNADVGQVTTDGSLVHLDGVRVPIGPRGLVTLHRATAVFTALGDTGLPEVRLHAFAGEIVFGDVSENGFHADISFQASENPNEAAWIWGELLISQAVWTSREGSPKTNPMNGRVRLYVTSRDWRLDGGRLDGEIVRAHFAGAGIFEAQEEDDESPESRESIETEAKKNKALLVPRALSNVALALEHAKVGPFVDVAGSLGGATIAIPPFLPLDAQLDGTLSWSAEEGGKADLRIRSQVIRAHVRGGIGPTGDDLKGFIEADVGLATFLRSIQAPTEAIPRDEDAAAIRLDLGGGLTHPEVRGTIRAPEVGFRFGRARFVPPVVMRDLESEVFVKDDRAVVRAVALARGGKITLDVDANVRSPNLARGTLRADVIEAAFLRDVLRTLGVKLFIADDVTGAIDLAMAPEKGEEGQGSRSVLGGSLTIATPSSKIVTVLSAKTGAITITGGITVEDIARTRVLDDLSVRPTEGEIVVALDVVRCATDDKRITELRGTAGVARLVIALPKQPEVPPFVVEGVTLEAVVDPNSNGSFRYSNLRFRGSGATFLASGTIPFTAHTLLDVPRISLRLEEGGAALAETLLHLTPVHAKVEPDPPSDAAAVSSRPKDERWIPRGLAGSGELHLFEKETSDARFVTALDVDLKLATPKGTRASVLVHLFDGSLDGSTLRGAIAFADLITTGFLGEAPPVYPEGAVSVDAIAHVANATTGELCAIGRIGVEDVPIKVEGAAGPIRVTSLMAKWRVDQHGLVWKDLEGRIYGGSFASSGTVRWVSTPTSGTAVSFALLRASTISVAVQELPAFLGQLPASFVRGWLTSKIVLRADAGGSFRAAGDLELDEASIPALDLARPTLTKYGLRPPNEDAAAPITAIIVGTDWGLTLRDVRIDLRGAILRGELGISRARVLDGCADVTLEEEYLRTSKMLTLPRVLTERLVLPVRIDGPIAAPTIDADLGKSLGHFLRDNRVRQFVESAVEEAQILLGRHPTSDEPTPERRRPAFEPELDAELRTIIDAHASEWDEIERRSAADARFRVA